MEVLYHIRPYFAGIFPYNRPYIGLIYGIGTSNESDPEMAIDQRVTNKNEDMMRISWDYLMFSSSMDWFCWEDNMKPGFGSRFVGLKPTVQWVFFVSPYYYGDMMGI